MGSYAKAKGRGDPNFIMVRHDLIDSNAWKSLSTNAQALWLHIARRYNGFNNGKIPLSCREAAEKMNVSKNTAGLTFKELEAKGLIKTTLYSNFTNKYRKSRRWALTHKSRDDLGSKNSPTNEWKKWKPDQI